MSRTSTPCIKCVIQQSPQGLRHHLLACFSFFPFLPTGASPSGAQNIFLFRLCNITSRNESISERSRLALSLSLSLSNHLCIVRLASCCPPRRPTPHTGATISHRCRFSTHRSAGRHTIRQAGSKYRSQRHEHHFHRSTSIVQVEIHVSNRHVSATFIFCASLVILRYHHHRHRMSFFLVFGQAIRIYFNWIFYTRTRASTTITNSAR
jgi:hypothetical protein